MKQPIQSYFTVINNQNLLLMLTPKEFSLHQGVIKDEDSYNKIKMLFESHLTRVLYRLQRISCPDSYTRQKIL